jgi:uncharacterized protein
MPPPPMPANLDPTTVSSIPPPSSPRVFTSKLISLPSFSSTPLPDPQASPSPSTPFANLSLLSPTASQSSNSSPLSPKLSILTSSFLSITSTSSPDAEPRGPMPMDVDKDPRNSGVTSYPPLWDARSPSPHPLTSLEPLRRVQSPPENQVESPSPTSSPHISLAAPEAPVDPNLPPALSPPPASPTPPPLPAPKVKMSLKDFAMRRKKQREEELARAAAQSPECPFRNGGCMDVVVSNSPSETPCSGVIDGANEATADIATPKVHTVSVAPVTEPTDTQVDSTPTLYNLPINGVHFDTSLASTLAEIAQAIPPSQGCHMQDEVGPVKGSTPVTREVICNGDKGGHLNNPSPHSSRTPSPSLSESEESETGASTTRGIPPTQPRSFGVNSSAALSSSGLPHRLPPSSTYRPGSSYVPPSIPVSVRPLPSGPRALRAGMGGFSSQSASPFASARGYPPGQFAGVPRGPSVDRERDRGWAGVARGRGRGAASSWR